MTWTILAFIYVDFTSRSGVPKKNKKKRLKNRLSKIIPFLKKKSNILRSERNFQISTGFFKLEKKPSFLFSDVENHGLFLQNLTCLKLLELKLTFICSETFLTLAQVFNWQ